MARTAVALGIGRIVVHIALAVATIGPLAGLTGHPTEAPARSTGAPRQWLQTAVLGDPDPFTTPGTSPLYAHSVSVSGGTVVVGSPGYHYFTGRAYVLVMSTKCAAFCWSVRIPTVQWGTALLSWRQSMSLEGSSMSGRGRSCSCFWPPGRR